MTETVIRQLLDKYWNCETSPEEEQILADFFSGDSIPDEWKTYRILFGWKKVQTTVKASPELKGEINRPVVVKFYSAVKIAASILLILTIGIGFYTHYRQAQFMDRIFSETYTDPEDALRDTKNAIEKVSSVLHLIQEQKSDAEKTDSLTNNSPE